MGGAAAIASSSASASAALLMKTTRDQRYAPKKPADVAKPPPARSLPLSLFVSHLALQRLVLDPDHRLLRQRHRRGADAPERLHRRRPPEVDAVDPERHEQRQHEGRHPPHLHDVRAEVEVGDPHPLHLAVEDDEERDEHVEADGQLDAVQDVARGAQVGHERVRPPPGRLQLLPLGRPRFAVDRVGPVCGGLIVCVVVFRACLSCVPAFLATVRAPPPRAPHDLRAARRAPPHAAARHLSPSALRIPFPASGASRIPGINSPSVVNHPLVHPHRQERGAPEPFHRDGAAPPGSADLPCQGK